MFRIPFPLLIDVLVYFLGAGGSVGFAVPSKNLSFAYVMNQLDFDAKYPRFQKILEEIVKKIDEDD